MIARISVILLIFDLSVVHCSDISSIGDQLENMILNERHSSGEITLNQSIADLNKVLSYLVKRIEGNQTLFTNRKFFQGFIALLNRITNITDNLGNSSSVDTTVDETLKNLNSFKQKLNDLMKSYIKTTSEPLDNTTDTSSTESLDYWNVIWKLIDKIDNQVSNLRETNYSSSSTEALGFIRPSDPNRNMIILRVLTQIKERLASNETFAQINKSLTLRDLVSKVVNVVDMSFTAPTFTTTPMPTTKPRGNGIINSIFSRLKDVFNNQMRATTPSITTSMIEVNENNEQHIKNIVSQVVDQILKEGLSHSSNF